MLDSFMGLFRGSNLIIREIGNGIVYPLAFWLAATTAVYLFQTYRNHPHTWRTERGVSFACAFLWVFFSESLRAGSAWLSLDAQRSGQKLPQSLEEAASLAYAVSALVLVAVFIRCIWLLAPKGGERLNLTMAVAFTAVTLSIAKYLT